MDLIALTRWNARGLEAELPALAQEMGLSLYDARLRLAAGIPVVLQRALADAPARRLLESLRGRGLGAVGCDPEALALAHSLSMPRGFELGSETCAFTDGKGQTLTLPYADVTGVVRAIEQNEMTETLETKEKKFDLGRAVLSGGVVMNKTVTKSASNAKSEQQQVAYLFQRGNAAPFLLKEHALNYQALGAERGASTRKSFEALMARLQKSAPNALFDQRLLTHKRKIEITSVRGVSNERVVSNSNAAANALAAQLLLRAHLEHQL